VKEPYQRMLDELQRMPLLSPHWLLQEERDALNQMVKEGITQKQDGCWVRGPNFVRMDDAEIAYEAGWQAWLSGVDGRANPYSPKYGTHPDRSEELAGEWMTGFTDSMDDESANG
jgi:hypothetical protein